MIHPPDIAVELGALLIPEGEFPSARNEGVVLNIQHFTIHDGPGIRTEIFLKGCALKCKWCSNPESITPRREIGIHASRCIGIGQCGFCLKTCPSCDQGVFFRHEDMIAGINRAICTGCMKCAEECPADAIVVWGDKMTVDEVMTEILDDRAFYEKSGGGVTISGGDPLIQWRFTLDILKQCHLHGIHTCLETELHCKPSILDDLYPYTDLVITDIKHMNSEKHREYTGADNTLILSNIRKTVDMGKPLIIRIPVIPGHNDDLENIDETARFIAETLNNRVLQVQFLPYRPLGLEKYESLSLRYPMEEVTPDVMKQRKQLERFVELLQKRNIPAVTGSSEKIP